MIPIHEQHNLYLFFCVLTIRKQLPGNDFERSGRGQEPSRGHKFSILENVVLHWDFTSAMRLHFRSDLVGVALVGATPLHLLSQTALPLKSPTGAFIAPLRCANAVPPQTLLRTDEEELCQIDTIPPQQFMRVKLQNNARHIPRIFPEIPAAYPDHYTSHGWTSEIRYSRMERREKGTLP